MMIKRLILMVFIAGMTLLMSACEKSTGTDTTAATDNPLTLDTQSQNEPSIYWAKPGFAPLFILRGPFKDQGMGDEIFKRLQQKTPGFNHINTQANYTRIITEMRKGTNMCAILHHKDERAEFMYFSKPVVITPSYQIYVSPNGRKLLRERFDKDIQTLAFDDLLSQSQGLKLAITPKQSYGPHRDILIENHRDKLEIIHAFTENTALIKRLANNSVDLVLAFPWVFNYELDLLGLHSQIHKIQLTDMPTHQVSNIACAKTPTGKRIIDIIDAMQPAPQTFLKEVIPEWLTPREISDYQAAYKRYFAGDGRVQ